MLINRKTRDSDLSLEGPLGYLTMRKWGNQVICSASDLVNFLQCNHLTTLDLIDLEKPLAKTRDDDQAHLIQERGLAHEKACLTSFTQRGLTVTDLSQIDGVEEAFLQTLRVLKGSPDLIYQPTFKDEHFVGVPDFLRRIDHASDLGPYSFEIVDSKLAVTPKTQFIIQLCLYSEMLSQAQGMMPARMHIWLGDGKEESFRVSDFIMYYRAIKERFLERVAKRSEETYPEPCVYCDVCHWHKLCNDQWLEDDHLNQVANITRSQIKKLTAAGISTLKQLAEIPSQQTVPRLDQEVLTRLRTQAALQLARRNDGKDHYDLVSDPRQRRGFARLPRPDPGDIFFDMEGDPLEPGGLEYLFGVVYLQEGELRYRCFWAHTRSEERRAFEAFMDFVAERIRAYPSMHIYHYAAYEETALKRLMCQHGTREAAVDNLLRRGKLVDLYKVVCEALRVSEPRYSIKNLETFYMGRRSGEVTNAGASMVFYENWRITADQAYLDSIRAYNEEDCRSTYKLREWLLTLRPAGIPWLHDEEGEEQATNAGASNETEVKLEHYRNALFSNAPSKLETNSNKLELKELTFQLLEFHRRAAKPEWWAMFARQEMSVDELIDDAECIGGLQADPGQPLESVKNAVIYTYRFPEQEFKLKVGETCWRADTLTRAGEIYALDEDARSIRIKCSKNGERLPSTLSLIPAGPIDTGVLRKALHRFADSVIAADNRFQAIKSLLLRLPPSVLGKKTGEPLVGEDEQIPDAAIRVATSIDNSYLFIQGPPGAGKTYTGARIIVELLARNYRIGISSNSHKAINNLLHAVEQRASERGLGFAGIKKASGRNSDSVFDGLFIRSTDHNSTINVKDHQLIAGTAWLFADEKFDGMLDYLFVDEAGQVALANLVAMGLSARNIILMGDQMQLAQPIRGVHPGRSGDSALDYLLDANATVSPDRGIFLATTWRMHEHVCQFISEAVYEGRLQPEPDNQRQRLILRTDAHHGLKATGICFLPVEHEGCSQRSEDEAELIAVLYESLLHQSYQDREGLIRNLEPDNILVVAPYNMQVNLLKRTLPSGARVGTVDKFQGQEAEVVLISMTTSSGDDLPRHIEFLYSKNRLNVAISRARCLAVVVANPNLLTIRCSTVEQMKLINTLCWVREYSRRCHSSFRQTGC